MTPIPDIKFSAGHLVKTPLEPILESFRVRLTEDLFWPNIDRVIKARTVVTLGQNSNAFYDFLSLLYVPKLYDLKIKEAKELFLPKNLRDTITNFKKIESHLNEEINKIDSTDLIFLYKELSSFKITEDDLYKVLGHTPFYSCIEARDFIREKLESQILHFVKNVKRQVRCAGISKSCQKYLSSLSEDQLARTTPDFLYKHYRQVEKSRTLSDTKIRNLVTFLHQAELAKRDRFDEEKTHSPFLV